MVKKGSSTAWHAWQAGVVTGRLGLGLALVSSVALHRSSSKPQRLFRRTFDAFLAPRALQAHAERGAGGASSRNPGSVGLGTHRRTSSGCPLNVGHAVNVSDKLEDDIPCGNEAIQMAI